ncbi:helicase associated domain-containing protein [Cordyceps javanica]|nr:helicase associated domain-containing protein [Cordyceps javanica]
MAGNKKKKKPVPNPARGFATTSIAAKPRPEATESDLAAPASASPDKTDAPPSSTEVPKLDGSSTTENPLSAEEFEKQLEESELQLLVEKLASKCKRDAARQRNRLETDRRLLRGQAESVNSLKWFNPDLMGHIQDLISGETRFSVSSLSAESHGAGKMPSEEEMVARLWTLQLTLQSAGFQETRIRSTVKHILDITPSISAPGRDLIWGLEESLDWLARECDVDELPAYENKPKPTSKGETPSDSPIPSRSATPKPGRQPAGRGIEGRERKPQSSVTKSTVVCDSDIEPDELIPEYVATRAKLLELSRNPVADSDDNTIANAKLGAKIQMIENDVLFDKSAAEVQWRAKKIIVEQQLAAARKQMEAERGHSEPTDFHDLDERQEAGINDEAERIAAEILAQGEEMDDLGGLFDSLPQNEVDPNTGKSQTVINGANGMRLVLKDFGKWTGMGPRRILEEACRSRDATVKIQYRIVSDASFASQKALDIWWNKAQELPQPMLTTDVSMDLSQSHFSFTMAGVATPDAKQAEAYIATVALFHIFNSNAREEKVNLRLPPAWRDVWSALAEAKKSHADAADRTVVKDLRSLVRERLDQELEDGVIIQGAFRGRGNAKQQSEATDQNGHRTKQTGNADLLRKIWNDKSNTSKFQSMLETKLVYATIGIVMRMLEGSNDLKEVTHLVLDEVHERSIDSDFLLIVLKRLMIQRKDLKVVLMSATVDADRFSAYLGGAPILNVPGRTFPVEVRYLEDAIELTGYTPPKSAGDKMVDLDDDTGEADSDSPRSDVSQSLAAYSPKTRSILYQLDEYQIEFDLIVQLIARIATDGDLQNYSNAILVFLPGIAEIRTLNDMLLGDPRFAKDWLVYPLHSTIATDDQESAFLIPPHGIRKIVLATNIAETGITIPDFCRKNFLSQQTLSNIEDLKGQLLVSLADSGFLPLTDEERKTLSRLRFSGGRGRRQQQFFEIPGRVNMHSDNDVVSASVVAWSFYPKLLVRDTPGMKGMRNIGNNQSISIHPSSVNRGHFDIKWLSYYHIMQSKSVYRAHETTAADPFAIALLCGDVRIDMFSGVIILDGNRGRFAVPDWKTMLAIKVIRTRLRELLTRSFKQPGKLPTAQHEKWLDVWQRLFTQDFNQEKSIGVLSKP